MPAGPVRGWETQRRTQQTNQGVAQTTSFGFSYGAGHPLRPPTIEWG
jgi:hypothetical protein